MKDIEELSFRVALKCQRIERGDDSQLGASSIQSQVAGLLSLYFSPQRNLKLKIVGH
jgi:hypothetical protein